ncbi:hypothetical protein NBRC10512_008167 [Rhodotorula toruloides]|uniref:RHTO0S04e08284g1_1 n=2 Tax=Rhodotorula toruloides TaxID=5286 RepID=A0A061AYA5_RHOTO|nr:CMP/dCMP deaminase [Rhodotorula toruloides NP11]EMS21241.1 CMP/dCMP deaminase [Rhodotorula toruloides NP11]CDR39724.1 RHTO0S04e08284g1_1 [Rhodotorula toruloides]
MIDPVTASTASPASSSQPSSFPSPSIPPTLEARISAYNTNVLPTDYFFDPLLSVDDNYMVLTLIYARLSMSKRGNMACIVVDPRGGREEKEVEGMPPAKRARREEEEREDFPNYPGRILSHSNNFPQPTSAPSNSSSTSSTPAGPETPTKKPPIKAGKQPRQPKPGQSAFLACAAVAPELHAEARAICLAAARGVSLAGSTAYVSFPPCQHCLPLLVAAGVRRLVYRQRMTTGTSVELCRLEGVQCVEYTDKKVDEQLKERVGRWWKERGEGREETRGRMEKWWREAEERVMGKMAAEEERREDVQQVNGNGQAEGDALPVDTVEPTTAQ